MTAIERYGPQGEVIERMVLICGTLGPDQMFDIAEAHRSLGVNRGAWEAWAAARMSPGREKQSGAAAYAVEVAMKLNALFIEDDETLRACGWAANDAGLAISTRDLIGLPGSGYSKWDFEKLMSSWRAGAEDPS
jgi:hypothetical protein